MGDEEAIEIMVFDGGDDFTLPGEELHSPIVTTIRDVQSALVKRLSKVVASARNSI
jgi:hypothetical protein